MAFVFRLILGAGILLVTLTAYCIATAPPCASVLAVMPELRTAVMFDACSGVVYYQDLPPLPIPKPGMLPL